MRSSQATPVAVSAWRSLSVLTIDELTMTEPQQLSHCRLASSVLCMIAAKPHLAPGKLRRISDMNLGFMHRHASRMYGAFPRGLPDPDESEIHTPFRCAPKKRNSGMDIS